MIGYKLILRLTSSRSKSSILVLEVMGPLKNGYFLIRNVTRFEPDLVILLFFPTNDIQNNYFEFEVTRAGQPGYRPFYKLDNQENLIPLENDFYNVALAAYSESVTSTGLLGLYRWLSDRVSLIQILRRAYLGIREYYFPLLTSHERGVLADLYTPQAQQTVEWKQAWSLTQRLIKQFNDDVLRSGAAFHIVIASDPLATNQASQNKVFGDEDIAHYDWTLPNQLAIKILTELELNYTDLSPIIMSKTLENNDPLHFIIDGHYTPTGHKTIAEELLPILQQYISEMNKAPS